MARKKATKSDVENEMSLVRAEIDNPLNFKLNVKCKTKKQKEFLNSIFTKEVSIVLGPAGTGKSYISIYGALQLLKDPSNGYKKIIFIYPIELSKEENLGALPGTVQEKIQPYTEADIYTMEKIIDASGKNGKEVVQKLISLGIIEFRPPSFLRGCGIDNSLVLVSECQNFSKDTFLKILTRIGSNSRYIFSGDIQQKDAQSIKSGRNIVGIQYAMEKLNDLPEFGIVEFGLEDILRNDLIVKILKRWLPDIYGDLNEEEEFKKAQKERLEE